MAHLLTDTDHMVATQTPWHRLGTVVSEAMTLGDATRLARLDWTVEQHPILASVGDRIVPIDSHVANVRSDTQETLGVVGKTYQPVQNVELADTAMAMLIEAGDVKVETAGSLRGGRTVWYLCRLPEDMTVAGGRTIPYMLFSNTHDGTSALRISATPVFVVCNNTLTWALERTPASWSTRHSAGIKGRLDEARQTLDLAHAYYAEWEAEVEQMIETQVSDDQFDAIVRASFPDPKPAADGTVSDRSLTTVQDKRAEVWNIYETAPEVGDHRGNGFGALQAFSSWDLWKRPVKGEKSSADPQALRDDRQAQRIFFGDTARVLNKTRTMIANREQILRAQQAADAAALASIAG